MVTKEETAKVKERALAQGVQVYMLELGKRYVALSTTDDGLAYEIIVQGKQPEDITCSCPGAAHRGICKHIGKVLLKLEAARPQISNRLKQDIADLYYQ
jgi:uncharacterized Zn finger protein